MTSPVSSSGAAPVSPKEGGPKNPALPFALTQFAVTKISHDLSNALSGVLSSAELLLENLHDKEFAQKAAEIALNSAQMLSRRLKFFRGALGTLGPFSHADEVKQALEEYLTTYPTPIPLSFKASEPTPEMLQLMALCVLTGVSAVIQDGELDVQAEGSSFTVEVKARKMRLDAGIKDPEGLNPENLSPRDIPLFLALSYAKALGAPFSIQFTENTLLFQRG